MKLEPTSIFCMCLNNSCLPCCSEHLHKTGKYKHQTRRCFYMHRLLEYCIILYLPVIKIHWILMIWFCLICIKSSQKKKSFYKPEDKGMEYLSVWRLRMAPMLGTLAGLRTLGTWGIWERGVTGAVGVVGVWGKLGGETDGRFFDMVTLETRFSCRREKERECTF